MNFIEQLFGISPDNGSGMLEFVLIVAPWMGLAALGALSRRRRRA
jgi:uncharacterized protein (TIGR03382 family)